jgi:hypothetical protein
MGLVVYAVFGIFVVIVFILAPPPVARPLHRCLGKRRASKI